jgi:hypothetical protein
MKFTLAIAFVLLVATAYGFRMRQAATTATAPSCHSDSHQSDGCTNTMTMCNYNGGFNMTEAGRCPNGNTTDNICISTYTTDEFGTSASSNNCNKETCGASASICDTSNTTWSSTCTSIGACVNHSTMNEYYTNGTRIGKLAYFI